MEYFSPDRNPRSNGDKALSSTWSRRKVHTEPQLPAINQLPTGARECFRRHSLATVATGACALLKHARTSVDVVAVVDVESMKCVCVIDSCVLVTVVMFLKEKSQQQKTVLVMP